MSEEASVAFTKEEIGLLLHWMYRAQAAGPAASHLIKKLQTAKRSLEKAAPPEIISDAPSQDDDSPTFFS